MKTSIKPPTRKKLRLLALACAICGLLSIASFAYADTEFGAEGTSLSGNLKGGSGLVSGTGGISIDPESGDIFVANGFNSWVSKFDSQGNPLFAWGWGVADRSEEMQTCTSICQQGPVVHNAPTTDALLTANGIAVDPNPPHHVYVTDPTAQRIEAFTGEGESLFAFGGDVVAFGSDNSNNNEVQKLVVSATGGTYRLGFRYPWAGGALDTLPDPVTGALPYNTSAGEIEAALNGLSTVNGSDVSGGSIAVKATGPGEFELSFEGNLGGDDVPQLQAQSASLTGGQAKAEITTTHTGGAGEICRLSAGDTCKAGGEGGASGEFASWPEGPSRIAVSPNGTVYAGDSGRVEKFDATGAYTGEVTVPGGGSIRALALDGAENLFVLSENLGVSEYDSSGTFLRTFPVEPLGPTVTPWILAVDENGNVYVGEVLSGGGETTFEFAAYGPTGVYFAQFTSARIHVCNTSPVGGALVEQGSLYVTNADQCAEIHHAVVIALPEPGAPKVESQTVGDVEPATATLHAIVNPDQFNTTAQFEYISDQQFKADGNQFGTGTVSTAPVNLGSIARKDPIQQAISGLEPGTPYRWRATAESSAGTTRGPVETFETLQPVSVKELNTGTVGPELVKVKAQLNPNGSAGSYRIEYGLNEEYSGGEASGSIPVSNEFDGITASFTGLQPNTEYHYRLIAENGYGETDSGDRTFTTEISASEERSSENCSNQILREEDNSLSLPDCRAYEQVTPVDKKGGQVFAASLPLAPSGEAVGYVSNGNFAESSYDFIQIPYLAYRSPTGWTSRAVIAKAGEEPPEAAINLEQANPELDRWLLGQGPALDAEHRFFVTEGHLSMGFKDGSFLKDASPTVSFTGEEPRSLSSMFTVVGYSEDLSHVFVATQSRLLSSDPRPTEHISGFLAHRTRLYEIAGADTAEPTLRLVDEVPAGLEAYDGATVNCLLDYENNYVRQLIRSVSADGSVVLDTRPIEKEEGGHCGEGKANPVGLFFNYRGEPPVQVNVPPPAQCHISSPCSTAPEGTVIFDGVSPDGRRAWFTTKQPLVDADTNQSNDLYMAELEGGSVKRLVLVSAAVQSAPSPGAAGRVGDDGIRGSIAHIVQGVIKISGDGSHVAFESPLVLTGDENGLGQSAVEGANNMYVYDAATEEVRFVTELCSGPGLSGTNEGPLAVAHAVGPEYAINDPSCPASLSNQMGTQGNDTGLWLGVAPFGGEVTFTPSGRYLLFSSWGRLTPGDDTDSARDLYRYDFASGELARVSIGHRGNDGNGNDDAYRATIAGEGAANSLGGTMGFVAEDAYRPISADGGSVVFTTGAPLVSRDTNDSLDVYAWEESGHGTCTEPGGCVTLISDGTNRQGSVNPVIGSSGRDIVFLTASGLAPADRDGVGDVYDARALGGFPPPVPSSPCGSPDACRPATMPQPEAPLIGSETAATGGNSPSKLRCAKGKQRVVRHGHTRCVAIHHKHKRRHRSGQ